MPNFTETAIRLYSRLFGSPELAGQLPDGVETVLDGSTAVAITEAAIADSAALNGNGANTAWQAEQQRNQSNMFGGQLGSVDAESGRGALAATIGLAMSGQRATAFLDSQQLAGAQDLLVNAAGRHLPLVLHLTNRALASQGAALGSGHETLHLSSESGCFLLHAMNVQQAVDFTLIARRVAEQSLIPGIVVMDGEQTAQAAQEAKLPSPQFARSFIGEGDALIDSPNAAQKLLFGEQRRRVPKWHDLDRPVLSGALQGSESYALSQAAHAPFFAAALCEILDQAFAEFARLTGRQYSAITQHNVEKSRLLLVAQGAAIETAIHASDELRKKYKVKVGVVGLHGLRPFPAEQLLDLMRGKHAVTVLERCDTPLAADGPLLRELRAASASLNDSERPRLLSAIYGTGGLPLRSADLIALAKGMGEASAPRRYLGLDFQRASSIHPKRQVMLDTLRRSYPDIASLGLRSEETANAPGDDALSVAVHHLAGEPGEALAVEAASFLHQLLGGAVRSRSAMSWERWGVAQMDRFSHSLEPLLDGGDEVMANVAILSGDANHPNIDPIASLSQGGSLLMQGESLPASLQASIKQKQIKVYALSAESAYPQEALLGAFIGMLLANGTIDLKARRILTTREESFSHLAESEREALRAAFEAGMESVHRLDTNALEASNSTNNEDWSDEAPLAVRHLGGDSEGYASLPRFWDQVGVLYRNDDGASLTADPCMASGIMPPLSATFCDHTPSRTTLPVFDAEKCSGCGKCWANCPDSAIGAVALSPKKLIDTGIRLASADALRQVGSKLAQRIAAMARKGEGEGEAEGLASGELLQQAFDWLKQKAPLPAERQQAVEADFIKVKAVLAALPLSITPSLFELAEKAQKDSGELLSLAINADSCKACGLCATVCADEALVMIEQQPELVAEARSQWQLWQQTPDTDSSTIERVAKLPEVGPMAAIMLSRHCAFALSGGDGAEAGSGEKIAVRQVLAATEYQQQPLLHRFISEINDAHQSISQRIRDTLADALPSEDLERLSAGLKSVHTREAGLGAFLQKDTIEGSGVDTHELKRLVALAQHLGELHWRLAEGEHGLGRARYGVAVAPGSAAAWAGTFPHNPFQAPVMVDMSGDAAQIAAGLLQGQIREAVNAVRLLRQARAELDAKTKASDLASLSWGDLTQEERQLCPPLILIGNDQSLGGRGFAQLAWLLNSELPVKVLVLSELELGLGDSHTGIKLNASSDSRSNLGMMALAQRKAFVAQSSIAAPEHLRDSVREGMKFTGPALINVNVPSPERHGFATTDTLQQAENAILSRCQPLFRYSPKGEGVFGSRLSLEGNPALKSEWYEQDGITITPAHWALGQQRFAPRLQLLASDAPAPTELLAWLTLDEAAREGKSPYIAVTGAEGNSQRLGVDAALANVTEQLAHGWRTLQELAGHITPFTARVEAEAQANLAAAHKADLDALRAEYEEKLRALEEGMVAKTHEQITQRLVDLAGYRG